MWKELWEYGKQSLSLTRETQQSKADIASLQRELKEVRQELQMKGACGGCGTCAHAARHASSPSVLVQLHTLREQGEKRVEGSSQGRRWR